MSHLFVCNSEYKNKGKGGRCRLNYMQLDIKQIVILGITIIDHGGEGDAALMGREARGWSFPNDGSEFWLNPPSGF